MALSPKAARSASGRHGSPWRAAGLVLVVLFMLTGAGLIGLAAKAPDPVRPPQPDAAAAPPFLGSPTPATAGAPPTAGTATDNASEAPGAWQRRDGGPVGVSPSPSPKAAGMPRSQPTRVRIPRIGVDATTTPLGLDQNKHIAVPPAKLAGWYKLGPSPGEPGTAVLVGHLDSRTTGPAVFFRLGALKPGDTIEVLRKDGTTARFIVDGVARYPKKNVPANLIYSHNGTPQLRLITCGGEYDKKAKSYKDNIVVFATLATKRAA
ncbi:class F sortase [Micromonospora sp. KC723]|uniref:class F sortase n=1 Tax=Micromonospora sp. KC723 TaxID=2530381 RepID=UPI001050D72E|nr:class F sortase [Micromonospora sp. KC723]TDB76200.1 class F sortase [Micromonospora sp. KC723]